MTVLRDVPVDVVQASVADGYIDLATEEQTQELNESRYHSRPRPPLQPFHNAKSYDPSCNMPVRRPPPLILCLHAPLEYNEILVSEPVRKEEPYATHEIIHVQSHYVCTRKDTIAIRTQEIRTRELPFGWCDREEEVWKCTQPYLAPQIPTVLIQLRIMLLVVTPKQHDAHQVSKSILHDIPIPS